MTTEPTSGEFVAWLLKVREIAENRQRDGGRYIGAYVSSLWCRFVNGCTPIQAIDGLDALHAELDRKLKLEERA